MTRASMTYTPADEESAEVALPGYVNPIPTIVAPGDSFTVEEEFVDELVAAGRFTRNEDGETPEPSRFAGMTKAEIGAFLDLDETEIRRATHDELVAQADEYERLNPTPPGEQNDDSEETAR